MIGTDAYLRKRTQHRIGAFFLPVFQRRKGSHADRDAVSFEHADKLGDVFGLIAVHHGAFAMLERPTRSAGLEHDRVAAEFINADLHRRARAQTRIEKHQRHRLARQRLRAIVAALEPQRRLDQ